MDIHGYKIAIVIIRKTNKNKKEKQKHTGIYLK